MSSSAAASSSSVGDSPGTPSLPGVEGVASLSHIFSLQDDPQGHEPITLVSAEGFEFVVSRRAAECSKLIREMIASAPKASPMNRLDFEMISPQVMEMICQFFQEKLNGRAFTDFAPLKRCDPTIRENRELVVDLLLAANYLDC